MMALQRDEISIDIAGVSMKVSRFSTLSDAFEVTAVIPRVELRIWRYQDGKLVEVEEKILNIYHCSFPSSSCRREYRCQSPSNGESPLSKTLTAEPPFKGCQTLPVVQLPVFLNLARDILNLTHQRARFDPRSPSHQTIEAKFLIEKGGSSKRTLSISLKYSDCKIFVFTA